MGDEKNLIGISYEVVVKEGSITAACQTAGTEADVLMRRWCGDDITEADQLQLRKNLKSTSEMMKQV